MNVTLPRRVAVTASLNTLAGKLTAGPRRFASRTQAGVSAAVEQTRERWRQAAAWERGQRTVLDAVAPEDVEHLPDAYVVQRVWTRTLVVADWPPRVVAGWLAPLLFELGGDVSLGLHVSRMAKGTAGRKARTHRTLQTTDAMARAERGALSDPATDLNVASATQVAEDVEAGMECLFSVTLAFTLRAPSQEALEALDRRVREHLDAVGVRAAPLKWQHRLGFQTAGLPYAADQVGRVRTLDTTTLAFSFPFLVSDVGTTSGPLWGYALHDRRPVVLDPWAEAQGWPAPHLVIVSPTGGGKTVTAGHLLMEFLTADDPPDVVLIDPVKGDYRKMVNSLGGQIVRMSTTPDVVINPFDLPPRTVLSGTGEQQAQNPVLEQARLVTGLIALMVAEEGEKLRKAERAVTEGAILDAYRSKGISPEDADTWDADPEGVPVLPDVLTSLERTAATGSDVAKSLAERLKPFCVGTLAGMFSRPTNLHLDAHLTSFDLEGLDSELRPLAVWTIGNHVWKVAKGDRRKRVLCLDEVKTLLEHPESARLVAHLYALGRAYGLSVWSMSQLLSDYMQTPEGERAIQNAHTVLLLRQASGKGAQDAQGRYALTDADRVYLESCRRGQGLLVTPKGYVRVQITPSPWELELMGGTSAAADSAAPAPAVEIAA